MPSGLKPDPYANDPGRWGASLTNAAEILFPCLDAAGAKSVAEVGAYAGDLTGDLIAWAEGADARVIAIDPTPEPQLVELAEQHSGLELIRETSHDALRHLSLPDAVIIDGDHNYYTVREELRLIGEKAQGSDIPLLLFHDVGWPHARRDTYFAPERIPEEHRRPLAGPAGLFPGNPGLVDGALPFDFAARQEGGPRNGVLTAIEDFIKDRDGLRLATVPVFFGFGVLWHTDAAWADAVAEVVDPWDRNPLLDRLESNRVFHLATVHTLYTKTVELEMMRERLARSEQLLKALLDSGGLAVADRLAGLRHPGRPRSWRDQVRAVLGDSGPG
jgi:hypothetical protein